MTELWSSALRRLSSKIAPQNFEMWLRPITCHGIEGRKIKLSAPNPYVRLWFESNYLSVMLDELRQETDAEFEVEFLPEDEPVAPADAVLSPFDRERPETGVGVGGVVSAGMAGRPEVQFDFDPCREQSPFVVAAQPPPPPPPPATPPGSGSGSGGNDDDRGRANPYLQRAPSARAPGQRNEAHRSAAGTSTATGGAGTHAVEASPPAPAVRGRFEPGAPLNPRYTFDTFVAGPSNQLAYAASQAAASTYPPKYNPIFICGGVGLGKTHLLHAIGHEYRRSRANPRILYLSGERFMNEYIQAIRTNKMHDFRRRYREGCDVLLIDDVQFLAGKDGTQDEFFHTFNALHDTHRQIVLTADRKPHEISDIADRLRTRFAWGLLADIEPPELEVRVAILRKKASAEAITLPDDVALYIASAVKSNVRELEGALIRLAASASLSQREISLEFARETLEGAITRRREQLDAETVIKAVASYYGLKVSDIKSSRRHKAVAGPRAVAMYLARTHTSDSYPDLGRAFGGKHHTTVISAVDKITAKLKTDPGLRGEIHAIESVLLRS